MYIKQNKGQIYKNYIIYTTIYKMIHHQENMNDGPIYGSDTSIFCCFFLSLNKQIWQVLKSNRIFLEKVESSISSSIGLFVELWTGGLSDMEDKILLLVASGKENDDGKMLWSFEARWG